MYPLMLSRIMLDLVLTLFLAIQSVIAFIVEGESVSSLMQNIGLGFLTILIPAVTFIFSLEKDSLFQWDKVVILDRVIRVKRLTFLIALTFLPLFFWGGKSSIFSSLVFWCFMIGIAGQVHILIGIYRWIKTVEHSEFNNVGSYREKLRGEYLEGVQDLNEKEKVWALTWKEVISNSFTEARLVENFKKGIDNLITNKQFEYVERYLQVFSAYIDRRVIKNWRVFEVIYPMVIGYYYEFSQKDSDFSRAISSTLIHKHIVDSSLRKCITFLTLEGIRNGAQDLVFSVLEEKTRTHDLATTSTLFRESICKPIFDNLGALQGGYDVWSRSFPSEWLPTKNNLTGSNSVIAVEWLNSYLRLASEIIMKPKDQFDSDFNELSLGLFPDIDHFVWSYILTIVLSEWRNRDYLESLIEEGSYPTVGAPFASFDVHDFEKNYQNITQERYDTTLDLAMLVFSRFFTLEKIDSALTRLEKIDPLNDSEKISRKEQLLKMLNDMKTRIVV